MRMKLILRLFPPEQQPMIGPMSLANIPPQTVTVLRLPASSVRPDDRDRRHLIRVKMPKT